MSEREEHDKLADDLERDADRLERQSEELQDEIADVRQDQERATRRDPGGPGAEPPPEDGE